MPIDYDAFEDEWDDEPDRRPARPRSVDELSVDAQERIEGYDVARVLGVDRGRVSLLLGDGSVTNGTFAGTMRGDKVVVGDRVRVRPPRHDSDVPRVAERLDRTTVLLRTADDAVEDERVVVANAEQVAVVVGVDHLDGGTGFADRVLVAASVGGLEPVVVLNKVDLVGTADVDRATVTAVGERFRAIGVPTVLTSALRGDGLDELRAHLVGRWTAFTGHSGVGKSALFNALVPDAEREVGEIGSRGGRHTTTSSLVVPVPGVRDAWLADTPGVRSFGLGAVAPEDLHRHFPELADLDWVEPGDVGTPVPAALRDRIGQDRLDTYRRLRASLAAGDGGDDGPVDPVGSV